MKLIGNLRFWSHQLCESLYSSFFPQSRLALAPVTRRKFLRSTARTRIARPHHYSRLP